MNTKLLSLDPTTQILIAQHVKDRAPSGIVLYALWFVTGLVGGHYAYLAFKCPKNARVMYIIYFLIVLCTFNFATLGWIMDAFLNMVHLKLNRDGIEDELVCHFTKSDTNTVEISNTVNQDVVDSKSKPQYDDSVWTKLL